MTPAEQAAREIVEWWREGTDDVDDWHGALRAKIAAAIAQARADEREACAKIVATVPLYHRKAIHADELIPEGARFRDDIAAAIRARAEEKP